MDEQELLALWRQARQDWLAAQRTLQQKIFDANQAQAAARAARDELEAQSHAIRTIEAQLAGEPAPEPPPRVKLARAREMVPTNDLGDDDR